MPISDVVASLEGADPFSNGSAPKANNAPSGDNPTTMDTPQMLPPYLHNQDLNDRSAFALSGTVLILASVLVRRL